MTVTQILPANSYVVQATLSAQADVVTIAKLNFANAVGIQITGTWTGTISFTGSVDGTNFVALNALPAASTTAVTSTTANGVWVAAASGLAAVRVVFTTLSTGGPVTVTLRYAPQGG